MDSLRLTIPSQQEGQHILVETSYDKLAEWLGTLPLADMMKALPEVTRAISSLNRTEIPYKKRAELVELFDDTYRLIHDYFRPKNNNPTLSKNAVFDQSEKLQNLTREMAFAHKIIVNDCFNKKSLFGKNKIKIKAVGFAIYYLGLMLIEQYEHYTPVPSYLWREVNALFAHAGKDNIENTEYLVSDNYCLNTIEKNYIRNCLIALADPYHLAQGEHWQIFHYLQNWIHLSSISEDPDDFRDSECFIIDVTSENKPSFVTAELDDPEDPKIRLLLTFDLIRQLEFDVESLQETGQLPAKSFHRSILNANAKDLFELMKKHWRSRVERSDIRYPIVTKVDVVWGLADVSRVIGSSQQKGRVALTFEEISTLTRIKNHEQLTWDAINVSSSGIGICSRQYMIPHISLGDIALIREYMDGEPSSRWRLAICRWHTGDKHNGTLLGLKYIDGQYSPVRLILYQGKNEKGGQPGIVVSNTVVDGSNSSTIITARGASQGDRVYAMLGLEEPVEVRPRVRAELTPCIERFFYQTYELRDELAEEVQEEVSDVIPWTAIPHEKKSLEDELLENKPNHVLSLDDLRLPGDI